VRRSSPKGDIILHAKVRGFSPKGEKILHGTEKGEKILHFKMKKIQPTEKSTRYNKQ
jgi:hypothetical protein